MYNNIIQLEYSYNDCQAKAKEVSSFVFREYEIAEHSNNTSITGRTSSSTGIINCVKRGSGVFVVIVVSTDFEQKEASSLQKRISNFMIN